MTLTNHKQLAMETRVKLEQARLQLASMAYCLENMVEYLPTDLDKEHFMLKVYADMAAKELSATKNLLNHDALYEEEEKAA